MAACADQDEGLTLLASGALEPDEEARVRAHVATCTACRAELEALHATLGACALPPPSAREQAVLAALPRTTVGAWRRSQVRQAARLRTAGALLAAAAVVLLTFGPGVLRRVAPHPSSPAQAEPTAEDTPLELEQWAVADPLSDALDQTDADPDDPDSHLDGSDGEPEDFLFTPPGGAP